jgi:hypothetical protein
MAKWGIKPVLQKSWSRQGKPSEARMGQVSERTVHLNPEGPEVNLETPALTAK